MARAPRPDSTSSRPAPPIAHAILGRGHAHDAVWQTAAAIDRGVEAGFLLEEDRAGMLAEAEAVAWPSPDAR